MPCVFALLARRNDEFESRARGRNRSLTHDGAGKKRRHCPSRLLKQTAEAFRPWPVKTRLDVHAFSSVFESGEHDEQSEGDSHGRLRGAHRR